MISHTARYAEARAVLDCREMKPEPLSPEEKLRAAKGAETEAETEEEAAAAVAAVAAAAALGEYPGRGEGLPTVAAFPSPCGSFV